MCTARLLAVSCSAHGGSAQSPPQMQTLPDADPLWMQNPLVMWPVVHAGKPPPPPGQKE